MSALSDEWEEYWDSTRKCVYDINKITGEKRYHSEGSDGYLDSDDDDVGGAYGASPALVGASMGGVSSTAGGRSGDSSLPSGWEMRRDPASGASFYFNIHTGEATWERPLERVSVSHVDPKNPWEERFDEASGVNYFFNTVTGEAQWERPEGMVAGLAGKVEEVGNSLGFEQEQVGKTSGNEAENWEVRTDTASGVEYYFNRVTGESQWDVPSCLIEEAASAQYGVEAVGTAVETAAVEAETEEGWEERLDGETGEVYYWNQALGEARWERPVKAVSEQHAHYSENYPPGGSAWEERTDADTGAPYYYNTVTEVSQWDMPPELLYTPPKVQPKSALTVGQAAGQTGGDWSMQSGWTKQQQQHQVNFDSKPIPHTLFVNMSCFATVKTTSSQWVRAYLQVKHDSKTGNYYMVAETCRSESSTGSKTSSGRSAGDFPSNDEGGEDTAAAVRDKFSFALSEVVSMSYCDEMRSLELGVQYSSGVNQSSDVEHVSKRGILFSCREIYLAWKAGLECRRSVRPDIPFDVKAGKIQDLAVGDVEQMCDVATAEEMEEEARELRRFGEELVRRLGEMGSKGIDGDDGGLSWSGTDSDSDLDSQRHLREGRKIAKKDKDWPRRIPTRGYILVLRGSRWVQVYGSITGGGPGKDIKLNLYSHLGAESPETVVELLGRRARVDKTNCMLSKHLYLFRVLLKGGQTFVFRALSMVEYWEWTTLLICCCGSSSSLSSSLSKSSPSSPSSSKTLRPLGKKGLGIVWDLGLLEELEECVRIVMVRRICLKGEEQFQFRTGGEFLNPSAAFEGGDSDDDDDDDDAAERDVGSIICNSKGFACVGTEGHMVTHGLPKGSVLTHIDGARLLRLPFSSVSSLVKSVPRSKPLEVGVRVPRSGETTCRLRGEGGEWTECSVAVGGMEVVFYESGTRTDKGSYGEETEMRTKLRTLGLGPDFNVYFSRAAQDSDASGNSVQGGEIPIQMMMSSGLSSPTGEVTIRFPNFHDMINWCLLLQENVFYSRGKDPDLIGHLDVLGSSGHAHGDKTSSPRYGQRLMRTFTYDYDVASGGKEGMLLSGDADDDKNERGEEEKKNDDWVSEPSQVVRSPSERRGDTRAASASSSDIYEVIDKLQAHLTELEEPLPTGGELKALREDLVRAHDKTLELWAQAVDKCGVEEASEFAAHDKGSHGSKTNPQTVGEEEQENLIEGNGGVQRESPLKTVTDDTGNEHGASVLSRTDVTSPENTPRKYGHKQNSFREDMSLLTSPGFGSSPSGGGGSSPLKSWTPRHGGAAGGRGGSSYMHLPTLSEICSRADEEVSPTRGEPGSGSRQQLDLLRSPSPLANVAHQEQQRSPAKKEEDVRRARAESDARRCEFRLPDRSVRLYGELLRELRCSPRFVVAVAESLGKGGNRRELFIKVVVRRLASRYVTSAEEVLLPIVREGVKMGPKYLGTLRQFIMEICDLPEVKRYGSRLVETAKEDLGNDDFEHDHEHHQEHDTSGWVRERVERRAMQLVGSIVSCCESFGDETVPVILAGIMKELNAGNDKSLLHLNSRRVFCDMVLAPAFAVSKFDARHHHNNHHHNHNHHNQPHHHHHHHNHEFAVERCCISFLRTMLAHKASSLLTIRQRSNLAKEQMRLGAFVDGIIVKKIYVNSISGNEKKSRKLCFDNGIHFESSFKEFIARPTEMNRSFVVTGREIFAVHSALQSFSEHKTSGRMVNEPAKIASILTNIGYLKFDSGDVDVGHDGDSNEPLEIDDNCYVMSCDDSATINQDALSASETAIEETNWLLLKARSKMQNIFGVRRGEGEDMLDSESEGTHGGNLYDKDDRLVDSNGAAELREILNEIRKKSGAIKMIIAEQGRLEASIELSELLQQSLLKCELMGRKEGGGYGSDVGNVEKACCGLLSSLIFEEGGGSEEKEGIVEGFASGLGLGVGVGVGVGVSSQPKNPLATLLTTVFNPHNLQNDTNMNM